MVNKISKGVVYNERLNIKITSELKEQLEKKANSLGLELSTLIRLWLAERLKKEQ